MKSNLINVNFDNGLAFIESCRYGSNNIAKKLLKTQDFNLYLKNSDAFFFCAKDFNIEMFTILLEEKIDHKAREYSAIKYALNSNNIDFIDAIVNSDNFFNIIDKDFFNGAELFNFKSIYKLKNKFISKKIKEF